MCNAAADHLHAEAHARAEDQGGNNPPGIGEYGSGKLGFSVQLAKGYDFGATLGSVLLGDGFCVDLVCVHVVSPFRFCFVVPLLYQPKGRI